MMAWLKSKAIQMATFFDLILIIALVVLLFKGGINITNSSESTSTSSSYANSSSSAISLNIVDTHYNGNNEKFSYQIKKFNTIEEAMDFYNSLNEGNLYNSQLIPTNATWIVKYRSTNTNEFKTKGEVTTVTVNGKEVKHNKSWTDIIGSFTMKLNSKKENK